LRSQIQQMNSLLRSQIQQMNSLLRSQIRQMNSLLRSQIQQMNSLLPGRVGVFPLAAFALLAFVFTSSAHEPITTKVRFNKEVIRTLQRSCLGCHHPGGIAMSFATYDEARPLSKAIKEEVL